MAKEKPVIMVKKHAQSCLCALSAIDAELLEEFETGAEFRISYASRRSNPQNSLYWVALNRVVKATGKWPTARKLHHTLLIECKFFTPVLSLDGNHVRLEADSTRFESMKPKEFNTYFELAMQKLAEAVGYDPLEFYEESA